MARGIALLGNVMERGELERRGRGCGSTEQRYPQIGVVETHQAPQAVPVAAPAGQASPAMTEAELVEELERARVLARRFGGGFKQVEGDLQGQLDVLRARAAP